MLTIEISNGNGQPARPLRIDAHRCVIGKDMDCEVALSGWRVSRRHAEVFVSNDKVFVRDLDSTFGTLVNDRKLEQAHALVRRDCRAMPTDHYLAPDIERTTALVTGGGLSAVFRALSGLPRLWVPA